MRNKLIVLFLPLYLFLNSSTAQAQEFKLFSLHDRLVFSEFPENQKSYSLSLASGLDDGADSVYFNYFTLSEDWVESDTCWFWTGNSCNPQNAPSWVGPTIRYDNQEAYTFYNLHGDSLFFKFNTHIDGASVFYRDSLQQFSITYSGTDTLTVLGQLDSVRFFTIAHTDLDGNPINSSLNGQPVVISKRFGLARFFLVDDFPATLQAIQLIGSSSPPAGMWQLTQEEVFDFSPGDEFQYEEKRWEYMGPPWENYTRYRFWMVLAREDLPDTIRYTLYQELFYKDSAGIVIDTLTKTYQRSKVVAEIPFEAFDGADNNLVLKDYCGVKKWTYTRQPVEDLGYCEADSCWGIEDLGRPPDKLISSWVVGLGLHTHSASNPWPDWAYTRSEELIYFRKGTESCGNQIWVGLPENQPRSTSVRMYPNPTDGQLHISTYSPIKEISVFNSVGTLVNNAHFKGRDVLLDMGSLAPGLYMVRVKLSTGEQPVRKLLVR